MLIGSNIIRWFVSINRTSPRIPISVHFMGKAHEDWLVEGFYCSCRISYIAVKVSGSYIWKFIRWLIGILPGYPWFPSNDRYFVFRIENRKHSRIYFWVRRISPLNKSHQKIKLSTNLAFHFFYSWYWPGFKGESKIYFGACLRRCNHSCFFVLLFFHRYFLLIIYRWRSARHFWVVFGNFFPQNIFLSILCRCFDRQVSKIQTHSKHYSMDSNQNC